MIESLSRANTRIEAAFAENPSQLGMIYMAIGTVFSVISIFASKVSKCSSLNTIIFLRALVTSQLSYRIVRSSEIETIGSKTFIKKIILRSLIGTLITYAFQKGLMHLSLKEFNTLFNTHPIFTFWLSLYFLDETFRRDKLACTVVTILGVALIVNPDYIFLNFADDVAKDNMFYFAVTLVLLSALLKAVVLIIVKTISSSSPFLNLLYFESIRVIVSGLGYVMLGDFFKIDYPFQFFVLVLSGLSEYTYHVFTILASRYTSASMVSILETLTILHGFLIDSIYYGVPVHFGSLVGTLLIVGSSVYLTKLKEPQNQISK